MADKYLHLRSVFEHEKTGNLHRDTGHREHPLALREYKLGGSFSLSLTLLEEDGVVVSLLSTIGLEYLPDLHSTESSETAWRLASNPNGRRIDVVPYSEGFIVDTNQDPFRQIDIAEHITLAFRTRQDFFGAFDGGAGNGVFLEDFITAEFHRIV